MCQCPKLAIKLNERLFVSLLVSPAMSWNYHQTGKLVSKFWWKTRHWNPIWLLWGGLTLLSPPILLKLMSCYTLQPQLVLYKCKGLEILETWTFLSKISWREVDLEHSYYFVKIWSAHMFCFESNFKIKAIILSI